MLTCSANAQFEGHTAHVGATLSQLRAWDGFQKWSCLISTQFGLGLVGFFQIFRTISKKSIFFLLCKLSWLEKLKKEEHKVKERESERVLDHLKWAQTNQRKNRHFVIPNHGFWVTGQFQSRITLANLSASRQSKGSHVYSQGETRRTREIEIQTRREHWQF